MLDRILDLEPTDMPTLICKADTLDHLERFDEALACAEKILASDATCAEAWETRGYALESRKDWQGLLDNCARCEAMAIMERIEQYGMLTFRAVALCALGREAELEVCLKACLRSYPYGKKTEEAASRTRASVLRRAGKEIPKTPVPN